MSMPGADAVVVLFAFLIPAAGPVGAPAPKHALRIAWRAHTVPGSSPPSDGYTSQRYSYLVLLIGVPIRLMADADSSWENAVPVQMHGSNIEILAVRSTWATDYDYARQMQGPVYFNDYVVFENRASIAATHVQFIFTLVDSSGELKTAPLPLDVRYSAEPDKREGQAANCRDHAYANGAGGYWLVAWVNRVDFADGSSWSAPAGDQLRAAIREAFPRRIQF